MIRIAPHRIGVLLTFSLVLFTVWLPGSALGQSSEKKRLCVRSISSTAAVVGQNSNGRTLALLTDALDGQLIQEIQRRRKFEIVADSALAEVLSTQDRNRGLGGKAEGTSTVATCDYALVVQVYDFQDSTVSKAFEGGTVVESRRSLRVGATAQIYRENGTLLEAVDFQKSGSANARVLAGKGTGTGGGMIAQFAEDLASRVATYTTDYIFPARILASSMGTVTFNRGEGADVAVGQIWEARIQGDVLVDPDTGEELGAEEAGVGWVKVIEVQPKLSRAEILLDEGVSVGAVLRLRSGGLPPAARRQIKELATDRRSNLAPQGGRFVRLAKRMTDQAWVGFPSAGFSDGDQTGETLLVVPPKRPSLAIFVKNRAEGISDSRQSSFADQVMAAAADEGFRVISREDVVSALGSFSPEGGSGINQERAGNVLDRALGESTSAIALANNLGADLMLLVSIVSLEESRSRYKDPERGIDVVNRGVTLRSSYRVTDGRTGETLTGDNIVLSDQWRDSKNLVQEESAVSDRLLAESAQRIAASLENRRAQIDEGAPSGDEVLLPIELFVTMADLSIPEVVEDENGQLRVTANTYQLEVMSVEVEIDGITVGTTGPEGESFDVTPGLHRVGLRRAGFSPVNRVISAKPGLRIMVPMELSPEGYRRWQENARFLNELSAGERLSAAQAEVYESLGSFFGDSFVRIGSPEATTKEE
ncbi:MAG: hypothetical protein P8K76_16145 [Candidatus Binatia bacterium]|nr:hypothetical protein [Candidatus Binatia bacterium]